jgi:hypothetical protein
MHGYVAWMSTEEFAFTAGGIVELFVNKNCLLLGQGGRMSNARYKTLWMPGDRTPKGKKKRLRAALPDMLL